MPKNEWGLYCYIDNSGWLEALEQAVAGAVEDGWSCDGGFQYVPGPRGNIEEDTLVQRMRRTTSGD